VDRIFEGDPAPVDCFENLVSSKTEKIIAKKGTGRLVPWVSTDYNIDHGDYRVIVSDPRKQSTELHQVMKDLHGSLPQDIKDRLYYISADTPAENRRWLKKNGLDDVVDVYSDDENMTWMRRYSALGENRWSMTMFIIRKGKVVKLARELDIYNAPKSVANAVKAMKDEYIL
jgi:peroxiredoxin